MAHQPVSVAIEADQKAFQLYMGGVFSDDACGTDLDHGVLVVGYGVDAIEGEYYIVKNSWGPEWGDKVRGEGIHFILSQQGQRNYCTFPESLGSLMCCIYAGLHQDEDHDRDQGGSLWHRHGCVVPDKDRAQPSRSRPRAWP